MEWIREGEVCLPGTPGKSDSLRAWRPWVLEEADGTLRMWYTGDDGTTSRILTAVRPPGETWGQPGIAIDAGFAGDTGSYGAESACVVKTPGGYLMVYGGFDGQVSRLHMARERRLGQGRAAILRVHSQRATPCSRGVTSGLSKKFAGQRFCACLPGSILAHPQSRW